MSSPSPEQIVADGAVDGSYPRIAPAATPRSSDGCPMSAGAATFDPFEKDFLMDPAEALRWARAMEPVFFSPKLGYWVVTRYQDVKAIFRDNVTFSPAIALEKVTPFGPEANAVLAKYDYAMDRTLVNEDEPHHMERRRALLQSFLPDELAQHEPMMRRLVRDYMDRFIDRGEVDLVEEMLWEIPLTMALHFLGVPEEDMDTLRKYSIAHTVNTWGRPTPEEQVEVAEAVGNFWTFAGRVLDKMRADPSGPGWMKYAIRRQRELPDVVTDSYLHSMMMAGIVAAHETTANATANALRLMLEQREIWDAICDDASLIPNAVEECLRLSGSIVAWRRIATCDTRVGEIDIPAGAKLLVVMTSANHDERHFENPDMFDIYRDNASDHLSFGYGSHQCLGKNLARMEVSIFVEELSRRLPHMELVAGQEFSYLPNIAMRGPDNLKVRWNPSLNPERLDPSLKEPRARFPIGAPKRGAISRMVRVAEVRQESEDVIGLVLEDIHGHDLPAWTPGAHIELIVDDYQRKYSLCGAPRDRSRYQIAILRNEAGLGGSKHIHSVACIGMQIRVHGPKNHFRLAEDASSYVLVAGGIGITPILAMADRLATLGADYIIHFAGRSLRAMAFVDRLMRDHGGRVHIYAADESNRIDLEALIRTTPPGAQIYACGPDRMLDELERGMAHRSGDLHIEHFKASSLILDPGKEQPFDVDLKDSGLALHVPADRTLLQVLREKGIDIPSDCEEGLCGSCEVDVIEGDIDHRDRVLSSSERATNQRMMSCCSRPRNGGRLVIGL